MLVCRLGRHRASCCCEGMVYLLSESLLYRKQKLEGSIQQQDVLRLPLMRGYFFSGGCQSSRRSPGRDDKLCRSGFAEPLRYCGTVVLSRPSWGDLLFAQCRPLTLDRWSPDPRYDVLAACGTWFQKGSGMSRQSYDLLALNLDRRLIVSPSFQSVVE
jgi:hypothetical protein